jgi:hypothetical protein
MDKSIKNFKTIEITPEEFYKNVPKKIVPKKALQFDCQFYFIPELKIYFIFNQIENKHYIFK